MCSAYNPSYTGVKRKLSSRPKKGKQHILLEMNGVLERRLIEWVESQLALCGS